MEETFPPGRNSMNFKFNPNFEMEKRICGYEHCIESMPFSNEGIDCPIFGHDCPGGIKQVQTCRREKGGLRSAIKEHGPAMKLHPLNLQISDESRTKSVPTIEDVILSHMPKLTMLKVHLSLLENRKEGDCLLKFQESIRGCKKIIEEFISDIEKAISNEKI